MGRGLDVPMTSRGNEVEHSVNTVVPESGVTLDTRLHGQNIIILSLEVADDLREAADARV
jgi:hypothetical protein